MSNKFFKDLKTGIEQAIEHKEGKLDLRSELIEIPEPPAQYKANPHVGEILKFEFIDELNMSQNALAKAIDVPANRIHAIVRGERSITADTDLRLCKFFGLSEGYFLRLQLSYELLDAKRELVKN